MTATFTNMVYGPSYWGVVYLFHQFGTVDYVSTDTVILNGTASTVGSTVSAFYNGSNYNFVVTNYDSTGAIVFEFAGNYYVFSNAPLTRGQVLTLTTDGPGDYNPPPCFVAGTRILTRRGEVPVEALRVGDEAVALIGGGLSRITWIGQRSIDCSRMRYPASFWPLRVRPHAFGPGRPHRTLLLSPDHALFVEGGLIPIRYLENGTTITREPCDTVTYLHIELAQHDVLLAEGLACESYLDTGNRDDFADIDANSARIAMLDAQQGEDDARRIWSERGCAPLHIDGDLVRSTRARLDARAAAIGHAPSNDPPLRLRVGTGEGATDHAARRDGDAWHFTLPEKSTDVRLVSAGFEPATRQHGAIDQRCLGVPVVQLVADGHVIPLHHPALGRGWHRLEPGLRWTAGAAQLPPLRTLSVLLAPIAGPVADMAGPRHPGHSLA